MKKTIVISMIVIFLLLFVQTASGAVVATESTARSLLERGISFFGIFMLIFLAYLLSVNRKAVRWRPVVWGVSLQLGFALIVLTPTVGQFFFTVVDQGVKKLLSFSEEGTAFVLQGIVPQKFIEQYNPDTGKFKLEQYPKFGNPRIASDELQNFQSFAEKLQKAQDPLSAYIEENLANKTRKLLKEYDPSCAPSPELREGVLEGLNNLVRGDNIYLENRFVSKAFSIEITQEERLAKGELPEQLWQKFGKPEKFSTKYENDRWLITGTDDKIICAIVKHKDRWQVRGRDESLVYYVAKGKNVLDVYCPIALGKATSYFLKQNPKRATLAKLNRLLLEDAYPELAKSGISEYVFIPKVMPSIKTFAFWILPTIIFFSALMTVLYHLGIMEYIIKGFAWVMQRTMGTSGAESLSAAANIFVGQTEAPLVIKPFVETMTKSELHAIMVGGFATVAGGVMAVYVGLLQNTIPGIAGHLVIASIMSAPAALAIAKVMFPETEESVTAGKLKVKIEKPDANTIEAAARGATDGMKLMLNVIAVLIAFVGLIAMLNWMLQFIPFPTDWTANGSAHLSLETLLGWLFYPIAFCMGVPLKDCYMVGILLGEKIALTELLAYIHLGDLMAQGALSQRAAIISSYALCGFANFASIGIQIGGIGGIAPSRRSDLAKLGLRAMTGGVIAACMTGTIAGIIIS